MSSLHEEYDLVIVGAGMAGLSLARQILMRNSRRILLVDKGSDLPGHRQKVGESTVQVGGYYLSKVLGLEEHLFDEHLMKYNLRFYWKAAGRVNDVLDDYGQSYIRHFSNIPCFQVDRNVLEAELIRLVSSSAECELAQGVRDLKLTLGNDRDHEARFVHQGVERRVRCKWLIDATGRGGVLARQQDLRRPSEIQNGSSFLWVEGRVDIDALGRAGPDHARKSPARNEIGHLPLWLATNHFMGRGFWLWVIPLKGKTSLGLVYDKRQIDGNTVQKPADLIRWICNEFPLFAEDLPNRRVLDHASLRSYSHDCARTIDPAGWAITGVAGRFTDPLYSPGMDVLALHNTFITSLVEELDEEKLRWRCATYERVLVAMNEALEPCYAIGYDALGDQEAFTLKYSWELTIYFSFYVFPFITDRVLDSKFDAGFLRRFSRLGEWNKGVQALLSDYHGWKAQRGEDQMERVCYDFQRLAHLRRAEQLFYKVDVSRPEALDLLNEMVERLEELARFINVWVAARVIGKQELVSDVGFVNEFDPAHMRFDEPAFRAAASGAGVGRSGTYQWKMASDTFSDFLPADRKVEVTG